MWQQNYTILFEKRINIRREDTKKLFKKSSQCMKTKDNVVTFSSSRTSKNDLYIKRRSQEKRGPEKYVQMESE